VPDELWARLRAAEFKTAGSTSKFGWFEATALSGGIGYEALPPGQCRGMTEGTRSNSESPYWRKSRYDPYTKNY